MVNSVLSVYHQGLRDWLLQRVTAIFMAIYSLGLVSYLLLHAGISFTEWHSLFSMQWMKVATMLFIVAILFHAWVGMWTVLTDYAKPFIIRIILNGLIFFILIACFFWGLSILWGV
jgi:succinate dehydrogenase / fumarate reductase membrane anchor subunit